MDGAEEVCVMKLATVLSAGALALLLAVSPARADNWHGGGWHGGGWHGGGWHGGWHGGGWGWRGPVVRFGFAPVYPYYPPYPYPYRPYYPYPYGYPY